FLEVAVGGYTVPEAAWRTSKVKYLFAYLAAFDDRPVPEDRLVEEFWPGDFERARRNLYKATSVIRAALREGDGSRRREWIVRERGCLQLDPNVPRWHDLEEVLQARSDSIEDQRRAVQLYRGAYLEGCYMDWALAIRSQVEERMLDALSRVARQALDDGSPQEASECARRGLEIDPCHQLSHLRLMQALVAQGRPEEAVRQFSVCQRRLKNELGVEPSLEIMDFYHRARLSLP
ncbi:MAG: BTAD domain-containing putative transcriptional regulator, partial [Candidatus Eremiobacterota bacterium]